MSATQFLIRSRNYGYDDECYYVAGTSIWKVHDSREAAEGELRKVELEHLKDETILSEHANFWNDSRSRMLRADKFVHEKTGKHVFSNWKELVDAGASNSDMDCGSDATLPAGMSDNDILEFGRIAEVGGFEIVEVEKNAPLHVLWDPREKEPVLDCDEVGDHLIYAESREALMELVDERTRDYGWEDAELEGSAEDLSESPALLEKFVAATEGLSWNKKQDELLLEADDSPEVVNALNALLRTPLFEIRQMDVPSLIKLEKGLD